MSRPKRKYHKRFEPVQGKLARLHHLYSTWANMLARCYYEKDPAFDSYGARGIEVCEDWLHFKNFVRDMGYKSTPYHSLDRIDNDKGYWPENCRWADRSQQCLNRRTFKTNKTGKAGVLRLPNGTYAARFDYEGVRYNISRHVNLIDAINAREMFEKLFFTDRERAIAYVSREVVWSTSTSGERGVTLHKDGGYVVRATVNKKRYYVGYFKNFDEAVNARREFIEKRAFGA